MALHRRKKGETVAAENKRLRQDTVAGRATKRQNVGRAPTTRAAKRQDTVAGRAAKRRNVGARTRRGR